MDGLQRPCFSQRLNQAALSTTLILAGFLKNMLWGAITEFPSQTSQFSLKQILLVLVTEGYWVCFNA